MVLKVNRRRSDITVNTYDMTFIKGQDTHISTVYLSDNLIKIKENEMAKQSEVNSFRESVMPFIATRLDEKDKQKLNKKQYSLIE